MKYTLLIFLLLSMLTSSYAQTTRIVSGIVTDSIYGDSLVGVSVILKDTDARVITDWNGEYCIIFMHDNPILEFSYLGFVTQEFRISPETTKLDVALLIDSTTFIEGPIPFPSYGSSSQKRTIRRSKSVTLSDTIKETSQKNFRTVRRREK